MKTRFIICRLKNNQAFLYKIGKPPTPSLPILVKRMFQILIILAKSYHAII